jgi:hypothetical protein
MSRYQILLAGGVFDFETRTNVAPDRSGSAWQEYQAWLTAGNTPLPPDSIGAQDLASAKAQRQSEIDAFSAGLRNALVRGRSAAEMASWTLKMMEARAYLANTDPLQAPTLAAIAEIRGIPLAELAEKVMGNAMPFLQSEAVIDGIRGKHCDAVEAMTDVRNIITYNWHEGWPDA